MYKFKNVFQFFKGIHVIECFFGLHAKSLHKSNNLIPLQNVYNYMIFFHFISYIFQFIQYIQCCIFLNKYFLTFSKAMK